MFSPGKKKMCLCPYTHFPVTSGRPRPPPLCHAPPETHLRIVEMSVTRCHLCAEPLPLRPLSPYFLMGYCPPDPAG